MSLRECVRSQVFDREVSGMADQFDVTLEDSDLLGEVEITTNLIIAASESAGPLTQEQIDAILGVAAAPEAPRA
jgi:hypothetical protein